MSSSDSDSDSDLMSVDNTLEWDELEKQLEQISDIHQNALIHFEFFQSQLHPQSASFEAVLEELHQNALKEIRETGRNPFGASLLKHFLGKSAQK
jgi:hypothetical protein